MNVRKALVLCAMLLLTASVSHAAYSGVTITGNGSLVVVGNALDDLSPSGTSIATGLWPNIMAVDPVGGLSTGDTDNHSMTWTFNQLTGAAAQTITANFTITPDLFTENAGDWATLDYWVKLELYHQVGGATFVVSEVHPTLITVADGDTLAGPVQASVSVTTKYVSGYGNAVGLRLSAYAAVEAFTADLPEEPEDPEEPEEPATIPAPGAVVLGSLGAGLVGWLRKRKTL